MNSQKQLLQTRLDIETLYNKGRKNLIIDEQRNKNMINLLKYAHKLLTNLHSTQIKNGQIYAKYHTNFKNVRSKVIGELSAMGEESGQMGQAVRKVLNQIIEELSAKARRFQENEKRVKELAKMRVESQEQNEEQEERVKEEMLDLIELFKSHAVDMGHGLKKDSSVIQNIQTKQQKVARTLQKQTGNVQQLNNSNPLGFLTLIGYSLIAVLLWIFTLMFIIVL